MRTVASCAYIFLIIRVTMKLHLKMATASSSQSTCAVMGRRTPCWSCSTDKARKRPLPSCMPASGAHELAFWLSSEARALKLFFT